MSRVKVLLVDDKPEVLQSIRSVLISRSENDYEVATAQTIERALILMAEFKPHVVVVDNFLAGEGPDGSDTPKEGAGFRELIPRLAGTQAMDESELPVIVAYSAAFRDSKDPSGWGVFAFVNKGASDGLRRLCDAVARAYDQWQQHQG